MEGNGDPVEDSHRDSKAGGLCPRAYRSKKEGGKVEGFCWGKKGKTEKKKRPMLPVTMKAGGHVQQYSKKGGEPRGAGRGEIGKKSCKNISGKHCSDWKRANKKKGDNGSVTT